MATSAVCKSRLASLVSLYFFPLESVRFHRVPRLEILEAFEPDTALLSCRHLPHVLFEMLQRADPALVDQLLPPVQLDPAAAADLAIDDTATCNDAQPRDLDGRDDIDPAFANLAVGRLAQALRGALDILGQLIDDVVVANLDLRPFRRCLRGRCGLEVEAHDDRVRNACEQQV